MPEPLLGLETMKTQTPCSIEEATDLAYHLIKERFPQPELPHSLAPYRRVFVSRSLGGVSLEVRHTFSVQASLYVEFRSPTAGIWTSTVCINVPAFNGPLVELSAFSALLTELTSFGAILQAHLNTLQVK